MAAGETAVRSLPVGLAGFAYAGEEIEYLMNGPLWRFDCCHVTTSSQDDVAGSRTDPKTIDVLRHLPEASDRSRDSCLVVLRPACHSEVHPAFLPGSVLSIR